MSGLQANKKRVRRTVLVSEVTEQSGGGGHDLSLRVGELLHDKIDAKALREGRASLLHGRHGSAERRELIALPESDEETATTGG